MGRFCNDKDSIRDITVIPRILAHATDGRDAALHPDERNFDGDPGRRNERHMIREYSCQEPCCRTGCGERRAGTGSETAAETFPAGLNIIIKSHFPT